MIVNETISQYRNILKNKWVIPIQLEEYMLNNGFKFIEKGSFSNIYAKPNSNFVIKIGLREVLSDGYLKFIKYVQENRNNPHLPKIGKLRYYNTTGHKFYIIPIERLEDIIFNEDEKNLFNEISNSEYITYTTGAALSYIGDMFGEDFSNTILDIFETFGGIDIFDGNNIMIRCDGTLVITDGIGYI